MSASKRARPDEPLAEYCQAGVACVCTLRPTVRHHKMGRVGAHADLAEHTLDLCDPCHRYIHAHPLESYDRGWMERRVA